MTRLALSRLQILLLTISLLLGVAYFLGIPGNPPGFFVDESSIAYNAHTIAQHGIDEHGQRLPLYFRAFGEYKSPIYIYTLAAIFKVTGPGIGAARLLSALLGFAAALLLGFAAFRTVPTMDRRPDVPNANLITGFSVFVIALLTPWLFELSRLVFEVALMPLALALLLTAIAKAVSKSEWQWCDAIAVALSLALITYSYSVGRMLAPLLAFGFVVFARRGQWWKTVVRTWLVFVATLVPLFVFNERHPGALGSRFSYVTYITGTMTWGEVARRFLLNYVKTFNPWLWLASGDPEPRHHLQTMGSLLVAPLLLSLLGLVLVIAKRKLRSDRWWWFVIYGLLISPIPAALTIDHFHTLRLIALPVFLLALSVPGIGWLLDKQSRAKQLVLVAFIIATLAQGLVFQWQFHKAAAERWHNFDTFYPEVFQAAVRLPQRPIYLIDNTGAPGYMHAYWYGTLMGLDVNQFIVLTKEETPPPGALVISTELPCGNCQMILERASFRAYVQK